ncbi:hypothetical protein C8J56DRAFT_125583 [Mycena floridula]|nr:hypothetical protein C8J56DRAFT_125583 [Mycena floridula]
MRHNNRQPVTAWVTLSGVIISCSIQLSSMPSMKDTFQKLKPKKKAKVEQFTTEPEQLVTVPPPADTLPGPQFPQPDAAPAAVAPVVNRQLTTVAETRAQDAQPEGQNTADNPTKKTRSRYVNPTLNGLKSALDILSTAPSITGVATASKALAIVVQGIQDRAEVKVNAQPLKDRIDRLWFYLKRAKEVRGDDNDTNEFFEPVEKQLYKLANDLEQALNHGKIAAFFSSADDLVTLDKHQKALDSMIIDLMWAVMTETKQKNADMEEECTKTVAAAYGGNVPQQGIVYRLDNNEIGESNGGFGIRNQVRHGATMVTEMTNNKIGELRTWTSQHTELCRDL